MQKQIIRISKSLDAMIKRSRIVPDMDRNSTTDVCLPNSLQNDGVNF